jgi:MFS family permease
MLPLFLVKEIQLHRGLANTIIGLSRVSGLVIVFLSGWITDRLGHRPALGLYLTVTGVLTFALGFVCGPILTPILVFLQAVASVCFHPAGFSLVSFLVAPRVRNLAISLVMVVGFIIGAGLLPTGIGYFAEAFSFSAAICIVGLLTLAAVPLLFRINEPVRGFATRE